MAYMRWMVASSVAIGRCGPIEACRTPPGMALAPMGYPKPGSLTPTGLFVSGAWRADVRDRYNAGYACVELETDPLGCDFIARTYLRPDLQGSACTPSAGWVTFDADDVATTAEGPVGWDPDPRPALNVSPMVPAQWQERLARERLRRETVAWEERKRTGAVPPPVCLEEFTEPLPPGSPLTLGLDRSPHEIDLEAPPVPATTLALKDPWGPVQQALYDNGSLIVVIGEASNGWHYVAGALLKRKFHPGAPLRARLRRALGGHRRNRC